MKTITFLTLIVIIFFSISACSLTFAQEIRNDGRSTVQYQQEIILQLSDLEMNGINSSLIKAPINQSDIIKLRNFDFSIYRNYYSIQEIQIENGPKIILYSIEVMISKGQKFEDQFIYGKKNIDDTYVVHPIIPVVNIGFGKILAPELH